MPTDLLSRYCQQLPKDTPPLDREAENDFRAQLSDCWTVIDGYHIEGRFKFGDFLGALTFTHRAGGAAESEGHHPEITLTWGSATVRASTHSINGLFENNFILEARLDPLA